MHGVFAVQRLGAKDATGEPTMGVSATIYADSLAEAKAEAQKRFGPGCEVVQIGSNPTAEQLANGWDGH